eukprot:GHVQ01026869.1.p1 GENE.GHVQ01026869.1~~GHVQ01026869.1.p1  ORF type:complete len:144 (-),score=17.47 GHVQ01026869.1:500-931(-)
MYSSTPGGGSTNITIKRCDIVKEGWLCKQSKYLQHWRRRWFVLTSECLCSFKHQTSFTNNSKPTEVLRLRECSTVKSADEDVHKTNAFRVDTPSRVFFLLADSNAEKESWIGHIGRQMVRPTVITDNNGTCEHGDENRDDRRR